MPRHVLMRRAAFAVAAAVARRRDAIASSGPAAASSRLASDACRGITIDAPIAAARISTTTRCAASRRDDADVDLDDRRRSDGRGYFYDGAPVSLADLQRRKSNARASSSSSSVLEIGGDDDDDDDDDDDEETFGRDDVDEEEAEARRRTTRRGLRTQRRLSEAFDSSSSSSSSLRSSSSSSSDVDRALASAAGSLSRRPHSRAELEAKLSRRGHSPSASRAALDKLRSMGLLPSDREFSRGFARARFRSGAWAPARIRAELVRGRGVSRDDAAAALRDVFGSESPRLFADTDDEDDDADRRRVDEGESDGDGDDDGCGGGGGGDGEDDDDDGEENDEGRNFSSSVFELSWESISAKEQSSRLLEAAERQAQLSKGLPLAARRRRLAGWLARRGHSWRTVSDVLKRVGL